MEIAEFQRKDQKETLQFCMSIFDEFGVDVSFYRGLDDFAGFFGKPGSVFLIVRDSGSIIGCGGLLKISKEEAEVKRFYIHREYRGTGLAQRLLEILIKRAKGMGYRHLVMDTHTENKKSQRFFKKRGFRYYRPKPTRKWLDTFTEDKYVFMRLKIG